MLATIAGVAGLAALFTFVPWLHAHGLYLRDAVRLDGQWWRWPRRCGCIWTGVTIWRTWPRPHGLLLLAGRATRIREMLAILAISGLAVQVALLSIPSVGWYGGLSGALHGWPSGPACGCCKPRLLARDRRHHLRGGDRQGLDRAILARCPRLRPVLGLRHRPRRPRRRRDRRAGVLGAAGMVAHAAREWGGALANPPPASQHPTTSNHQQHHQRSRARLPHRRRRHRCSGRHAGAGAGVAVRAGLARPPARRRHPAARRRICRRLRLRCSRCWPDGGARSFSGRR